MTLADRIREAMGEMTPGELARAAHVTAGAVTQWLDGTTKSLKAEKAALLETATGYRASWIVTGRGPKKIEEAAAAEVRPEQAELMAIWDQLSARGRFALTQSAKAVLLTEVPLESEPRDPRGSPASRRTDQKRGARPKG